MNGHIYTNEEKAFFGMYVTGHSYREIQKEFIKQFGWNITLSQIKGFIKRHKLNTGRTGAFVKGHIPYNKGKKMSPETYEKVKETMFKKGNVPPQHRSVGSERVTRDGYIEIKIAEPNKWMLKHRYIWEQANGIIPKGYIVIFRDNDSLNFELDNLMLISRRENAVVNRAGLSNTIDEAKESAVNYEKLLLATSDRRSCTKN